MSYAPHEKHAKCERKEKPVIDYSKFLFFDGAMGTMLQKSGLQAGELPELLNLTSPETILSIHKEYVNAGADIITSNTFGANRHKMKDSETVKKVIKSGIDIAKKSGAKYVALDIGPTGAMLKPIGTMEFDTAYDIFKEQVLAGSEADIILIETMSDLLEMKAAVLAAKENSNLPVFATMTYTDNGRTFLGTDPISATITLCGLGVDAVGVNCSLGPAELKDVVSEILNVSTKPVIVQANAGLPEIVNGETVFPVKAKDYTDVLVEMADMGVSIIGGCCGTTPEYIYQIKAALSGKSPNMRKVKNFTAFTSGTKTVMLDKNIAIIGERINPTGKKKIKEALRAHNHEYIISEAVLQEENGADILDVNAGLPEIDESATLKELITELQGVTSLPLQIDSTEPKAIEEAVRVYNGKPIINSVNGKKESMEEIFPIVKKYGAAVVALTLDENGIPDYAEDRYKIAEKIINKAAEYGIPKTDILIDCLVLSASTNQENVLETTKAITLVKNRLGVKTVLGVSNVSFGLPSRDIINSTFLAIAFGAGLDMPIMNPSSADYMKVVSAFKVLNAEDKSSVKYIEKYSVTEELKPQTTENIDMKEAVIKGRKDLIHDLVVEFLKTGKPMDAINNYFIPALDIVGDKFEKDMIFLPQLMTSAETVKIGFDVIKNLPGDVTPRGDSILIATVKGDIHDIGKNIVKMLLENYGYNVVDLGKDVPPETICDTAEKLNIKLVGLSALMTTTLKYMEETIKLLRSRNVDCKIMVGGAVLNEQYAKMVGADYYAKDAAESAKIAAEVFKK